MRVWCIAGTDTDVGKTYWGCRLAKRLVAGGRRVGVYKPVESGVDDQTIADSVKLWHAAGRPGTLAEVCPQRFAAPLAPPVAAAIEDRVVDADQLIAGAAVWLDATKFDEVIIEGAGGLFSPVTDGWLNIELFKAIEANHSIRPRRCLVSVDRLGTLSVTIATVQNASHSSWPIHDVWLNHWDGNEQPGSNLSQLRRWLPEVIRIIGDMDETNFDHEDC